MFQTLRRAAIGLELTGFEGVQAALRWEDKEGAAHLSLHPVLPVVGR